MNKREVLKIFKSLHRTRKLVFQGDKNTLEAGRTKINDEFKKNKHVINQDSIKELINLAISVEKELKTTVIQAVEKNPGVYELKIRDETNKLDNIPSKCSNSK